MKIRRTAVATISLLVSAAALNAQWAASASGSSTAAGEINSKPAWQTGSGAPSALNCTVGKDFYTDAVGLVIYGCIVTGTPGTWAPISAHGLVFGIGSPGGPALTTSNISPVQAIAFGCTIGKPAGLKYTISLGSGDSGTVTVKFWKVASGTAIPTSSNSISTSGLGIASGTAVASATFADFTSTAVTAGDMMAMAITAISATISSVTAVLPCQ